MIRQPPTPGRRYTIEPFLEVPVFGARRARKLAAKACVAAAHTNTENRLITARVKGSWPLFYIVLEWHVYDP